MKPKEIWKDIPGIPNYQASNFGRIKRLRHTRTYKKYSCTFKEKLLKLTITAFGYLHVNIHSRCYLVHRLVLLAFVGPVPKGLVTNHIDGNKQNNKIENLEITTYTENHLHAFRLGLRKPLQGEKAGNVKITDKQVKEIRRLYAGGQYYQKELAKKFKVSQQLVSRVIRKEIWKHL